MVGVLAAFLLGSGLQLLCKALKGDIYNTILRNWSLTDFACRNNYVYQEHPLFHVALTIYI